MQQWFPLVGRVLIGLLFLTGAMKFMSIDMVTGYIASTMLPMPVVTFWISTILEVVAAVALIIGFKTRYAAWFLFIYTGLTVVFFHFNWADHAQMTMALKNLAIMGGLLYVIMYEAGMRKESVPSSTM